MEDLKNYTFKKRELNRIVKSMVYADTVVDDIVFFTKYSQEIQKDKFTNYIQMFESETTDEVFSFKRSLWLEDFNIYEYEFAQLALSCFGTFKIDAVSFYEEGDDEYMLSSFGVTMSEYIASQFIDYLSTFGLVADDLHIDYGGLVDCCEYTIIIVKMQKELFPFLQVSKFFNLYPTSQKDTYIGFIEDWGDGFNNGYYNFNLKAIKREVIKAKPPIIKENKNLSNRYKKLKYLFSVNTNVDEIYNIMDTKKEVMF